MLRLAGVWPIAKSSPITTQPKHQEISLIHNSHCGSVRIVRNAVSHAHAHMFVVFVRVLGAACRRNANQPNTKTH